jgi:hypothetical protein
VSIGNAISKAEFYKDDLRKDERFIGEEFRRKYGSGSGLRGRSVGAGAGAGGCNVSASSDRYSEFWHGLIVHWAC